MRSIFKEPKEIQEVDFGHIKLTLKEFLDRKQYTRNQLSVHTGIKYTTINRYYHHLTKVNTVFPAKILQMIASSSFAGTSPALSSSLSFTRFSPEKLHRI